MADPARGHGAITFGLATIMATRSTAREVVMQLLYACDLNADLDFGTMREMIAERIANPALRQFAESLLAGVLEHRRELDDRIEAVAENWSIRRMSPTDRNILRLAAYELIRTDTPPRVAIDEAVELAKRFGGPHSAQFVNGILDKLIPPERRSEL